MEAQRSAALSASLCVCGSEKCKVSFPRRRRSFRIFAVMMREAISTSAALQKAMRISVPLTRFEVQDVASNLKPQTNN